MTRVGITGGSGYLPTAVTAVLEQNGYDPVRTAKSPSDGEKRLDVRDRDEIDDALDGVDVVVHCAAAFGSGYTEETMFVVNVQGTENVAWWCRENGVPLVFVSSVAAVPDYSTPVDGRLSGYPRDVYGLTKAMSERDVVALSRETFPAHVLRLSNVYGDFAGARDDYSLVAAFVGDAISDEKITVHGSGSGLRDLLHVEDAATAIVGSVAACLETDDATTEILSVGSGDSRSILDVARTTAEVIEETGAEVTITHTEDDDGDVNRVEVDTAPASERLGFDAEITLTEGISGMARNRTQ